MSQDDLYINGELLRLGREARGWVIGDMATRACMSVKQIRQLEEGGTSAFYSPAVKMTSAKKLAGILELSPEQVFARPGPVEAEAAAAQVAESELLRTDDQPAVHEEAAQTQPALVIETPAPLDDVSASPAVADEPKTKTSVWAIAALFAAAIGVAAYMQKQEEPATEPPPPLQVLPAEAETAASSADAAASNASAASDRVEAPAASTPIVSASTPMPAVVPAAPPAAKPAASAASKPL